MRRACWTCTQHNRQWVHAKSDTVQTTAHTRTHSKIRKAASHVRSEEDLEGFVKSLTRLCGQKFHRPPPANVV